MREVNSIFGLLINGIVYCMVAFVYGGSPLMAYLAGCSSHVATVVMFELTDIRKTLQKLAGDRRV